MPRRDFQSAQQGAVLLVTLVALAFLLLAATALLRSSETSNAMAGSLGFKRDLVNQAERAMKLAIDAFTDDAGTLATDTTREANLLSSNYFAAKLDSNSQGIPLMLLKDSLFTGTADDIEDSDTGITIRYVIDRLCDATGEFDYTSCVSLNGSSTSGGSASNATLKVGLSYQPVYRISVRVDGPNESQAYLQTTITD